MDQNMNGPQIVGRRKILTRQFNDTKTYDNSKINSNEFTTMNFSNTKTSQRESMSKIPNTEEEDFNHSAGIDTRAIHDNKYRSTSPECYHYTNRS